MQMQLCERLQTVQRSPPKKFTGSTIGEPFCKLKTTYQLLNAVKLTARSTELEKTLVDIPRYRRAKILINAEEGKGASPYRDVHTIAHPHSLLVDLLRNKTKTHLIQIIIYNILYYNSDYHLPKPSVITESNSCL